MELEHINKNGWLSISYIHHAHVDLGDLLFGRDRLISTLPHANEIYVYRAYRGIVANDNRLRIKSLELLILKKLISQN